MKPLHVILLVALVSLCTAAVSSHIAYRRGYRTAVSHDTVTLIITLDALEGMRAGKDVTGSIENVCFTAANRLFADDYHKSSVESVGVTPRLIKYWDAYWANRPERPYPMSELESQLKQRR
jgi:effector-binding domain-containing protein